MKFMSYKNACLKSFLPAPSGYTLVELTVSILLAGILCAVGVTRYIKASENAKADHAKTLIWKIAFANRLHKMDHGAFVTGALDATSELVADKYLPAEGWDAGPYIYYAADSASNPAYIARAARKTSGADGTSMSPYSRWGSCIDSSGGISDAFDGVCGTPGP